MELGLNCICNVLVLTDSKMVNDCRKIVQVSLLSPVNDFSITIQFGL